MSGLAHLFVVGMLLLVGACSGGGGDGGGSSSPPASITYTISGTVTGLNGSLTLQNNGDTITIPTDGSFTFSVGLADGTTYSVDVIQPLGQTCGVIANGTGTINGANITMLPLGA